MSGRAAAGNERTLIDLPSDVKAQAHGVAAIARNTFRLEVIAALVAWLDQPDPDIRAQVAEKYDGRRGRARERTPQS